MTNLVLALAVFVGTHFLMSHPLRAMLVKALGSGGFQGLYSVIALIQFGWVIMAFRAAPVSDPFWVAGEGLWAVATAIMLVASILLVGSFMGNPAMPRPDAKALTGAPARGVFAITRHPMMWAFALWSAAHALVAPNSATLLLTGAIALLSLGGSMGQDRKKAALMGDGWRDWSSRTSFLPFARQLSGQANWSSAWPGLTVTLGGIALWLIASYAHPWLGAPLAGIWRWMG